MTDIVEDSASHGGDTADHGRASFIITEEHLLQLAALLEKVISIAQRQVANKDEAKQALIECFMETQKIIEGDRTEPRSSLRSVPMLTLEERLYLEEQIVKAVRPASEERRLHPCDAAFIQACAGILAGSMAGPIGSTLGFIGGVAGVLSAC